MTQSADILIGALFSNIFRHRYHRHPLEIIDISKLVTQPPKTPLRHPPRGSTLAKEECRKLPFSVCRNLISWELNADGNLNNFRIVLQTPPKPAVLKQKHTSTKSQNDLNDKTHTHAILPLKLLPTTLVSFLFLLMLFACSISSDCFARESRGSG